MFFLFTEAPQWQEPGEGDADSDEESDDRLAGLMRLLGEDRLTQFAQIMRLLGTEGETSGAAGGEVRHNGVTCDSCKKPIFGACFKCGYVDNLPSRIQTQSAD